MKPGFQLRVGVGHGRAVDPNFEPRTLDDGRVCCESPAALCATCQRYHALRGERPRSNGVPSPDPNALRNAIRAARGGPASVAQPDRASVLRAALSSTVAAPTPVAPEPLRTLADITVPSPSVFDAIKQQRSR